METVVIGTIKCTNCGGLVRFERPAPTSTGSEAVSELDGTGTLHEKCGQCGEINNIEVTGNISGFKMRILPHGEFYPLPHEVRYLSGFNAANGGAESCYHALESLTGVMGSLAHTSIPILHRMYLMQAFSNFEAFLYDCLGDFIIQHPPARLSLVEHMDALKDRKFSLAEIEKSPELVLETLRDYLKTVSFHNFSLAQSLFSHAMGIDILPTDRSDRRFLFQMLKVRHDCVHRNGLNQAGQPIENPLPNIPRLLDIFTDIVQRVHRATVELQPSGAE
ncbi:hypothetical protein O9X90_25820 [Agrobacterium leguminum]|uniref:hypothetical protein n=1 Tax=Agrobacterium leguminum TaxID=2792015 RepID=UPI0022B8305A|nr:hypothetical protein [Agrobacterium leguminum]MCZ7935749.1 hypothetical protein [Agrobacterium leguminum]